MDHVSHAPHRLGGADIRAKSVLTAAAGWVEAAFRTARERRALMRLDEHALKDIGLSRADAYAEWSRPFWDVPGQR